MLESEKKFLELLITNKVGIKSLLIARFFFQWKASLRSGKSPITDRRPWMTFQSIEFLEKYLKHGSNVFEYGGGGSTLYCLDKGAHVVTVEHDLVWFSLLEKAILKDDLSQSWKGIMIEPTIDPGQTPKNPSNPKIYQSYDDCFNGFWFKEYVSSIDYYPESFFDFVLVDGRSRPSCLTHAALKVKIGGFLLLDNTERSYYLSMDTRKYLDRYQIVLDEFGPTPGALWFTKTTIWKRVR
ncbi:MAG: hypothetical protein WBJ41_02085 [Chromatiaceae bacterium]